MTTDTKAEEDWGHRFSKEMDLDELAVLSSKISQRLARGEISELEIHSIYREALSVFHQLSKDDENYGLLNALLDVLLGASSALAEEEEEKARKNLKPASPKWDEKTRAVADALVRRFSDDNLDLRGLIQLSSELSHFLARRQLPVEGIALILHAANRAHPKSLKESESEYLRALVDILSGALSAMIDDGEKELAAEMKANPSKFHEAFVRRFFSRLKWTDDCQGKKDYDGEILTLSSRYWPRGGGYHVSTGGGPWEGNETRPEIKPSAVSSILLFGESLVGKDFEGETQEEVQRAVEAWVEKTITSLVDHLRSWKEPTP